MARLVRAALRQALFLALPLLLAAGPAWAQGRYSLDPGHARIGFSVSHLGLFQSEGEFKRFESQLVIDPARPDQTEITVAIDAASVAMTNPDAVAMLRSPAHLDVAAFPVIRFRSTSVHAMEGRRFRIAGRLEIRGVTRDVALDAALTERQADAARRGEVADFEVTGTVNRSAFGMVADRDFISDAITLRITARLLLPGPHDGN